MCKFTTIILLTITLTVFSTYAQDENAEIELLRNLNNTSQTLGFSRVISNTTTFTSFSIPVIMGTVALLDKNEDLLKNTLYVGATLAADGMFTYVLKKSFHRSRPYVNPSNGIINRNPLYPTASNLSFPSGHTSLAFATATALTFKYPKWYVIAPSYLWACSVGYSRMNLGVHYPTDVLAGAILGSGSAYLTYKINEWFWNKNQNKKLISFQTYL